MKRSKDKDIEVQHYTSHGFRIQKVGITSEQAAKDLDKSMGDYFTLYTGNLDGVAYGRDLVAPDRTSMPVSAHRRDDPVVCGILRSQGKAGGRFAL